MATKVEIRHTFNCDADTFWEHVFGSSEFNTTLYREGLEFPEYEIIEDRKDDAGKLHRKVRTTPKSDAPATVRKVIGDSISYVEEGIWDPSVGRYRFSITTSKLADKVRIGGELWVEPKGEGKIERRCDMDVEVKIFGVGRVVEAFVAKSLRDSYGQAAVFTNRWIADKGL